MLDILEDYLQLMGWPMERIDGSVGQLQRQAAIDRFSKGMPCSNCCPDGDADAWVQSLLDGEYRASVLLLGEDCRTKHMYWLSISFPLSNNVESLSYNC